MECFHPIEIPIRVNGVKTKSYQEVPCGRCYACRERIQNEWIFRLSQEERKAKRSYFVTLTYSDENPPIKQVPLDGGESTFVLSVKKDDVQKYIKRLRKRLSGLLPQVWCEKDQKYKPDNYPLRYYLVSEYGHQTHRPHYHALFFSEDPRDIADYFQMDWPFGFIQVGTVTEASIAYSTKYLLKDCEVPQGAEPCFSLSSRRPAIGLCYLTEEISRYHQQLQNGDGGINYLTARNGRKLAMPRYYRDKLGVVQVSGNNSSLETEFFRDHPDANMVDFYLWRKSRVEAYEENKVKRSKQNSKL